MYRKKDRRVELVERVLKYSLMVFGVVTLLFFLMFNLLGYRFNFTQQTVVQTGLVQYDTVPRGARVLADGQLVGTTSTKNTLLPGNHTISMTLDGYEPWNKTIDVKSGMLTSLQYVRMIPSVRQTAPLHRYTHIQDGAFSPYGRYLITISDASGVPELQLTDLRDVSRPIVAVYPLTTTKLLGYDKESVRHTFSIAEWDQSGRYILVEHRADNRPEWLVIDREQPTEFVNVSTLTGLGLQKVVFVGTSGADGYGLTTSGDIRQINLRDGTLSRPLISLASDFSIYGGDTIVYVGRDDLGRTVGVWKKEWSKPQVVMQATSGDSTELLARISRYYAEDSLAIVHGNRFFVYRGDVPSEPESLPLWRESAIEIDLNTSVNNLQVSGNGRFITVQQADGRFVTYDCERKARLEGLRRGQYGQLDDYYTWTVDAGGLQIQEFDGTNRHQLAATATALDVTWSDGGRYLLYFAPVSDDTIELRYLTMRVN